MYIFDLNGDYKTQFKEFVDTIMKKENHIEDRIERNQAVETLIESYTEQTGERPHEWQLGRLTNYLLLEELTDNRKHKSQKGNSILSKSGVRHRQKKEVSIESVYLYIGSDGKRKDTPRRSFEDKN
jgi:hypothetical protein